MLKEEGVGRKEGACAFRLRCRGFLLIGGEIYWVPVRVTRDLKPHIVGVIKPQEIYIRSDRYSLSLRAARRGDGLLDSSGTRLFNTRRRRRRRRRTWFIRILIFRN